MHICHPTHQLLSIFWQPRYAWHPLRFRKYEDSWDNAYLCALFHFILRTTLGSRKYIYFNIIQIKPPVSRHISSPSELPKVLHLTSWVQNSIWILISDSQFVLYFDRTESWCSSTSISNWASIFQNVLRRIPEHPETTIFSSIVLAGRSFCDNRNVFYLHHPVQCPQAHYGYWAFAM